MRGRRAVMLGAIAGLMATGPTSAASGDKFKTEAQLYRGGVRCMEVFERDDCAIRSFESLVERNPRDRTLAGDAMLRLVKLYQQAGREDDAKLLLRKFWDLGMRRHTRGVVPYSTRFFPAGVDQLVYVDVDRVEKASVFNDLSDDAKHLMFTCDERLRERLREQRRQRRKARQQADGSHGRDRKRGLFRGRGGGKTGKAAAESTSRPDPVHEDGLCALALALGHTDLRQWKQFVLAENTADARVSMAAMQVVGLDRIVGDAVRRGTLVPSGERVWTIAGLDYHGGAVQVASLDRDELLLGPAKLISVAVASHKRRSRTLNRELRQLIGKVPRDVSFFVVMTKNAMHEQFSELGAIKAVLPTPDGLLISAVAYDYAGIFVRMPTSNSLKAWAFVAIVRSMLETRADDEQADDDQIGARHVDVSTTPQNDALMMSVVLTRPQVQRMFAG